MNHWWRSAGTRLRSAAAMTRNNYHTIQAIPRESTGPRISARDRAQGRIPAVVLTQQSTAEKQLLTTESKQINSILKSVGSDFFCSTTFKLQIRAGSGSSHLLRSGTVLPIKLHRDEESGKVMNMVLVWADQGSAFQVDVPLVFKGLDSSPGLTKGGQLYTIRKSLKYLCPVEHIPQKIEVDISNLDIGDKILLNDIKVDPSIKLLSRNETKPICKIIASKEETLESTQA